MAVLVGKEDPLGRDRRAEADRGKACAGKSTLNRLELSSVTQDKYRKTPVDEAAVEAFLVEQFIRVRGGKPKELVLDLDATDDPLHTESRRVVSTMATTGVTATCPCMCFARGMCWGAKLRVSNSGWLRRSGPGDGADRGTTAGEVAEGPHYSAGGQQLCPRGVDEMV